MFQDFTVLQIIFVFIVCATITSFCCLAAERLPHQLGWRDNPRKKFTICSPPSQCNYCGKRIKFLYLLPVIVFFLTKGRCSHCHRPIPRRYPVLELAGGCGGVCIFIYFGSMYTALWAIVIFLSLLFLSLIDIYEHWLPAIVTYPLFWLGLAFSPFCILPEMRILGAMLAFFVMYLSMLITGLVKKEDVFAGGDIALATAAGAWLGLEMLHLFLLITSLSFISYALPLRLKGMRYSPMGPALALGFMACLFLV
ncbi:prepilin peptidase [Salmonella enterica]|nr:prepilin peptidase [Salmonella enterica]